MNLENQFQPIRDWAYQRGLYDKGNPPTQFLKLAEEMGELAEGLLKKKDEEVSDAIGDIVVVLTNLAHLCGMKIEHCINGSFTEIANRTGKMENGTFVRDK